MRNWFIDLVDDIVADPPVCQQADCVGGYLPTEEGDRYRCPDCAALSAGTAAFTAIGSPDPKAVSE